MNENTPEKALTNFLNCWKDRNFSKMTKFTQITWRTEKGNKDAKQFLKDFYGIKKLIFFELKDRILTQEIFIDIEVMIKYKLPHGKKLVLLLQNMDGIIWTTIRRHTSCKERYYREIRGSVVNIVVEEKNNSLYDYL